MELFQMFGTNTEKEKSGIKIVVNTEPEIYFTLARAGGNNKKYQELLTKLLVPYKRQMDMGTLSDGVSKRIMIEAFCRTCLLGWGGVKNEAGDLTPFTVEAAMDLMERLPDLHTYLWGESQKLTNFQDVEMEAIAKN